MGTEQPVSQEFYRAEKPATILHPEPGLQREVLVHSPALMLVRHTMRKGWQGTAHTHPHEQLIYVLGGRIGMTIAGRSLEVSMGDNLIVASNVEHQATALEDSVVLDVFTPAREDYTRQASTLPGER